MSVVMSNNVLRLETQAFRGCGGISAESGPYCFHPAFRDDHTGAVYLSRFADGRPAPCHLLDGLPAELVVARSASGQVAAVRASVISGFVRGACFYTREEAASLVSHESSHFAAA